MSVDAIRAAAARAAKADGIRATARDIGMSVTGFRAFLEGSNPFASTREKLTAWYLRRAATGEPGPTPGVADAALAVLVAHLPREEQEAAVKELRDVVKRRTRGTKPDWLK